MTLVTILGKSEVHPYVTLTVTTVTSHPTIAYSRLPMSSVSTPAHDSDSPAPGSGVRYVHTAVEKQRAQLDRLLKDPSKPAFIPPPPKEKTIRAPREMMKNVQGSSAGAGSGEFHVYKASRRREYERLKLLEEQKLTVSQITCSGRK